MKKFYSILEKIMSKNTLNRKLAEFMDERIMHYANKFQGTIPPLIPFEDEPDWYKKTMEALAKEVIKYLKEQV
jgi:hypothetical protein